MAAEMDVGAVHAVAICTRSAGHVGSRARQDFHRILPYAHHVAETMEDFSLVLRR